MSKRSRIVRTKDIQGGLPRIEGTRWLTQSVRGFDFDRDVILQQYPHLAPEQVDAAIRYERTWGQLRFIAWRIRYRVAGWIVGIPNLEEHL